MYLIEINFYKKLGGWYFNLILEMTFLDQILQQMADVGFGLEVYLV